MPRRERGSLKRRPPKREPRRRVLILCEGKITEPKYFTEFKREHRTHLVEVEIVPDCGVPKSLVETAIEKKKAAEKQARKEGNVFLKYDEIWCVFDVDAHPNLQEAKLQAQNHGLKLAISNPCFELWILLHFRDQRAHQERGWVQSACRGHMPEFVKEVPYEKLKAHYDEAVRRARLLWQWQTEQGRLSGNPSTSVYLLTETMIELGKEGFLKASK